MEKIRLSAKTSSRLPEADIQDVVRFCPKCGRQIPVGEQLCAFCANTGMIPRPALSRGRKLRILGLILLGALVLLLGLDLIIRAVGPLGTAVPTDIVPTVVTGTSVPVILMP